MSLFLIWESEGQPARSWALGEDKLSVGSTITVGRNGGAADLRVDDPYVSQFQLELSWLGHGLQVQRTANAKNPIFFRGAAEDEFVCPPGGSFTVGRSAFRLTGGGTLLNQTLGATRERRLYEILAELPERLSEISRQGALGANLEALAHEMACELLGQVTSTRLYQAEQLESQSLPHRDYFALSQAREQNLTVTDYSRSETDQQLEWSSGVPIRLGERSALLLLKGRCRETEHRLVEDTTKILDLLVQSLAVHLVTRENSAFEERVSQFFSPHLRGLITPSEMDKLLKPKKVVATLMFFDLRGFSKNTEAADQLDAILEHHEDMVECITEVTEAITATQGIVIDFQGDGIFACWGALERNSGHADSAARCLEQIAQAMYERNVDFGVGLGTGNVIAGQVGGREQKKFGLIGNIVNLSARLEGLTKKFGVKVLTNSEFAGALSSPEATRKVGLVQPAGLEQAREVHELLISPALGGTRVDRASVEQYERALDAFQKGQVDQAMSSLQTASLTDDPVSRFLMRQCLGAVEGERPKDGVFRFLSK